MHQPLLPLSSLLLLILDHLNNEHLTQHNIQDYAYAGQCLLLARSGYFVSGDVMLVC